MNDTARCIRWPLILQSGVRWMCWSPAIFGGRIVGFGATKEEAYSNWERKAKE